MEKIPYVPVKQLPSESGLWQQLHVTTIYSLLLLIKAKHFILWAWHCVLWVYLALITDCLTFLICILLWIKGSPKWVNVNAWFSVCNHTSLFCPDEGDGFNPLKIEVFLQTLLHLAAKSFSHSFSALAKWVSPAKPHTGLPAAGSVLPLLLLTNAACNC